jgi:type VI secretion system protein ImpE
VPRFFHFVIQGGAVTASALFKAGKLQEAIDAQLKVVKNKPADQAERLFLFELAAFAGDLDRARKAIEAISYGETERDAAIADYRRLVDAEQSRRNLFSASVTPRFLGETPDHVRLRLEAANRLRENRPTEALDLLAKAAEASPTLQGQLNDKPFSRLRDCDDLFGTVLEVLFGGDYCWVPLEQVAGLAMNPPAFPRDLIWIPARLELRDGSAGEVHLPALYPGSHEHADDQIKLGRATDWKTIQDGPVLGMGQRTFLVDDDALSILEWRQLVISEV